MPKAKSERQRWTQIYVLPKPITTVVNGAEEAKARHRELLAVVSAFEKVGRVVRVETAQWGDCLVFKARRA